MHHAIASEIVFEGSCANGGVAGGVLYDTTVEATGMAKLAWTGLSIWTDGRRGTGVCKKAASSGLL